MAAYLYPGIKSLQLVLDKPYDAIRTTDVRDDLASIKVWYSLTTPFDPNNGEGTLVPSGNSLSVTITGLAFNTRYYVKYAFVSAIDPDESDPVGPTGPGSYTVSAQLTAVTYDENVSVYGYLTNDHTPIVTKSDGTGGDFTSATGVFKLFYLSQDVTGGTGLPVGTGPVYAIKASSTNNITGAAINATTGVYSCTGLTNDSGNVTFTATYNNIVVEQLWNVYRAKAGELAPIIQLSTPNKEFLYKDQFATSSQTPSTTVTARLLNLTGTVTFTVDAFTRENTSLGTIAFTQSGNTITITKAQFEARGVTIGTAKVTATLGTVSDVLTLYRINDGSEQITVELSNESHQIPAAPNGVTNANSYVGSGTIIEVKEGNTYLPVDNSADINGLFDKGTWTITTIDAVDIVCDTTPAVGTTSIEYDKHSAMDNTKDVAYIDYTITGTTTSGKAFSIVKRQSFAKSKDGNPAISATLSNGTHVFPADKDGNVTAYTNSGTEIRVYEGATELVYDTVGTSNSTWKVATGTPSNITAGTITDSGIYATVGVHSGVGAETDTSNITYTITGKSSTGVAFTITQNQTFSKSKIGATGATGVNTATVRVYKPAATIPTGPTGTSTYTWASSTLTAPSDTTWALVPPAASSTYLGQTLWAATVTISDPATTLVSTVNWVNAGISAFSYYGSNGAAGAAGVSARVAYAVTTTTPASTPANVEVTGDIVPTAGSWFTSVTWVSNSPASLTADQSLYQVDGLYNPATNKTNWIGVPYLSSLKVGSLSAITTSTGSLNVTGTFKTNTGNPVVSGSTMTGYGGVIVSDGTFALGNSTTNIAFNGLQMTLNGNVVSTGNIISNSVTGSASSSVVTSTSTESSLSFNITIPSDVFLFLLWTDGGEYLFQSTAGSGESESISRGVTSVLYTLTVAVATQPDSTPSPATKIIPESTEAAALATGAHHWSAVSPIGGIYSMVLTMTRPDLSLSQPARNTKARVSWLILKR
jgi:hypothetical protein